MSYRPQRFTLAWRVFGMPRVTEYGGPQWRQGFWAGVSLATMVSMLILLLVLLVLRPLWAPRPEPGGVDLAPGQSITLCFANGSKWPARPDGSCHIEDEPIQVLK